MFARARNTDPITSHEAADAVKPSASQQAVLRELKKRKTGLAGHELEARLAGRFSPERIRTARKELERQGRVMPTDQYRMTRSGRRAQVWVAA